jgi:hypothetical protein
MSLFAKHIFFPLFVLGISLGGCSKSNEVGVRCSSDVPDAGVSTETTPVFNKQALSCESKLCLLYNIENPVDAVPICTRSCTTDSDCPADPVGACQNVTGSERAFVCRIADPVTEDDFRCCKMCVCADWVADIDTDPSAAVCQGVTPTRCTAY